MDQTNAFRERIETGDAVIGARTSTFSPSLVEIYGALGLDFVWLDFEHAGMSPWNSTVFENLTRSATIGDVELLVRIPKNDPALIRKVLDAGVRTVLIPRVDGVDDVRKAIEAARFVYDGSPGERGMAHWRSSGFGSIPEKEYTTGEDQNVCIGAMIEKVGALEELDEILALPELGFVFPGPGDFSVQLGHPGERDHPRVREAITEIETTVLESEIPLGGIAQGGELAIERLSDGYQILRIGDEFEAVKRTIRSRLDSIENRQTQWRDEI